MTTDQTASANADWSVLRLPGVMEALGRAARHVASRYDSAEVDDLLQEAVIIAASRADWVREQVEAGYLKRLTLDIGHDLENPLTTERRRGGTSLDAMLEASAEDGAEGELADGDDVPQRQRIRTGEYGGKMAGLRWAAPNGSAGGRVTTRRVA